MVGNSSILVEAQVLGPENAEDLLAALLVAAGVESGNESEDESGSEEDEEDGGEEGYGLLVAYHHGSGSDSNSSVSLEAPPLPFSEPPSAVNSAEGSDDEELYSEELALSDLDRIPGKKKRSRSRSRSQLRSSLATHDPLGALVAGEEDEDQASPTSSSSSSSCGGSGSPALSDVVVHTDDVIGNQAYVVVSGYAAKARYEMVPDEGGEDIPRDGQVSRIFRRATEDRVVSRVGFWGNDPYWLYMVADGHGGADASEFVVNAVGLNLELALRLLFDPEEREHEAPPDLDDPEVRAQVVACVQDTFAEVDRRYLDRLREAFVKRKAENDGRVLSQAEIEATNPDQGTTLTMALVHRSWVITANVGDSRVMVAQPSGKEGAWEPLFASKDHNVNDKERAAGAAAAGATFWDVAKNAPRHLSFHSSRPRSIRNVRDIYVVPPVSAPNDLDVPRRKLAMTATMGDFLFKMDADRPVLTCTPDVEITRVSSSTPMVLVVASDGVWHALPHNSAPEENACLASFVGQACDEGVMPELAAKRLVCTEERSRETPDHPASPELYHHYDDSSAIVVYVVPQGLEHPVVGGLVSPSIPHPPSTPFHPHHSNRSE